MIDHMNRVRQVIARTLGVPLSSVGDWTLVAKQDAHMSTRGYVPGMIRAELSVRLVGLAQDVRERFYKENTGSWYMDRISVDQRIASLMFESDLSLNLLYGKETQHVFKAAYQMFTVRGKQKGRRK